jgi:hypothetical protein
MSAKGWHSGDCYIHYARPDREANQRLMLWPGRKICDE